MSFVDKLNHKELHDRNAVRFARVTGGRIGSELASFMVSHASVELIHKYLPNQYKEVIHKIATKIIEPHIKGFDKLVNSAPAIFREEDGEGKMLKNMNNSERANLYAEDILDLGMTIPLEMIAQGITQGAIDRKMGMPDFKHQDSGVIANYFRGAWQQSEAVFADKAIQLGSVIAMNSTGIGHKKSEDMEDKMKPMLKKVFSSIGVTDQGAERMARQTISMGIPNLLGMAGSVSFLDNAYKKELAELITQGHGGRINY